MPERWLLTYLVASTWLVACVGGCAAHPRAEPEKITAIKDLVDSLARERAGEGSSSAFVVTIAPTVSGGSVYEEAWRDGCPGRLEWSRDTIGYADVATVVETRSSAGRIAGVEVDLYFWSRRHRWITQGEMVRERYPRELAALEALISKFARARPEPDSRPATRQGPQPPLKAN